MKRLWALLGNRDVLLALHYIIWALALLAAFFGDYVRAAYLAISALLVKPEPIAVQINVPPNARVERIP